MMKYLIVLFLLFSHDLFANARDPISVYSYHLKPPLIIDRENRQGLYFDFIDHLNEKSAGDNFVLISVPRKRLERMLESDTMDGVLLGVNPVWFKDKGETRYFWTGRVFTDRDEIVSLKSSAIEYSDSHSIKNRIFGGVRGFYYHGINELVDNKQILRVDTAKETDLFRLLILKRIDVAVISRSTFDYQVKLNQWQDKFHLSKTPHDIFDRRILVPKSQKNLYTKLSVIVDQLQYDKSWQMTLLKYR